ncbi:hypothetical protein SCLCIDRAFT_10277 [Scleroderma citrinum Foug A]|uniref:Uncharacterized protein n=1 Tax=Scleroderma citrinum Foug A TaxID=1036808 RepID=A0A0C3DC45_9AGAM|nr:hypothetical protein SCLCIDRAFT_10277 [Scleroderma citrinum Foug A]
MQPRQGLDILEDGDETEIGARLLHGPLLANRTVILVTHHVEVVLPETFYLIRMLDGCINTQGTVKDLHAHGILDGLVQHSVADVKSSELSHQGEDQQKQPRKLVKDEHREQGGVKFLIYKFLSDDDDTLSLAQTMATTLSFDLT